MTEQHEHNLVWVTSPDGTQARRYCKGCGQRGAWGELPPELQPPAQPDEEGKD